MQVQKIVNIQGDWAKVGQDILNGDVLTILDGGQEVDGTFGKRLAFKVSTRSGEKQLAFNQTSINNLIDVFGTETTAWAGRKIKANVVKQMVKGKMADIVYLAEPSWVFSSEGVLAPATSSINSTIQQGYEEPAIDVNTIPF